MCALGLKPIVLWLENSNYLLCSKSLELSVAKEHLNTESAGFMEAIKLKENLSYAESKGQSLQGSNDPLMWWPGSPNLSHSRIAIPPPAPALAGIINETPASQA